MNTWSPAFNIAVRPLGGLLEVRLGPVFQVFGLAAVFNQLAVRFLVTNDDGACVHFDDLPLDRQVFDKNVIVAPQFHNG